MLHKCFSAFCPPLFSVPLVISPLAFLPFLRYLCGYLFCPFSPVSSASPPLPLVASASSTRQPTLSLCLLPWGSWYLRSPFLRCLDGVGGLYTWSSAHVLPQAPIGVSSLSAASPLLSVPRPAVPSSSLPAFQPQGVSGFSPLTPLLPSSSLTWPVSSAPGWGSPLLVSVFPCYLRCSAWRSFIVCCLCLLCSYWLLCGSLRLCLSAVSAFWGSLFPCSLLQGFQWLIFILLFALLLLPPLRVSLALPLRCPGLVRILVSLQFAPGFFSGLFSSSFLRCSCCLFAFPQLRLAPSLISLALLLCLAVLRLMLRCLGLLRLLPSSSLSVWLGSSCPLVGVCGSGRYRCCGSGS